VIARLLFFALRILAVLYLLRLLLRWLAGLVRPSVPRPPAGGERRISGDLVRDRVCNTFLPRDRAVRAVVAGQEEHFCSVACRDRALAGGPPTP
jgi:hypothetical protein